MPNKWYVLTHQLAQFRHESSDNKCDWEVLQVDMMTAPWQKFEKCEDIDRSLELMEIYFPQGAE